MSDEPENSPSLTHHCSALCITIIRSAPEQGASALLAWIQRSAPRLVRRLLIKRAKATARGRLLVVHFEPQLSWLRIETHALPQRWPDGMTHVTSAWRRVEDCRSRR